MKGARFERSSKTHGYAWRVFVDVTIRRNSDGKEVTTIDTVGYPAKHERDLDGPKFMWSRDGNYGCDCNRFLFFERALTRETLNDIVLNGDLVCGEGAYTIIGPDWLVEAAK